MKAKIIGCGLSGITSAILLKEKGYEVEIFDSRDHIGGNCYDEKINNITLHKYGAHIFHTNDKEVWEFLNRYTTFNNYQHKVRANTSLGLISIPYNYFTRDQIGKDLTQEEIQSLIFKDYSERHWGIKWENLPKSISGRLPNKRDSYDDLYFTDTYQGIPSNGYTNMMNAMLDGITVHVGVDNYMYKKFIGNPSSYDLLIYTGKPDDYFDYCYGNLEYRSLRFEHFMDTKNKLFSWSSGSVINECNNKPYNRTIDNSIFLNETTDHVTLYTRDYPCEHDETNDPIYPKNFGNNIDVYNKYNRLIKKQKKVLFLGRLATYKYLDMWMAIKQVMVILK
jgi:UDP-galactopyranose mutase